MLRRTLYVSSALLLLTKHASAFNLYPHVDADRLAKAFGIGIDCLTALNETVTCDQTLFEMASEVDNYRWEQDNVTSLCTSDCISSSKQWWSDVADKCDSDTLNAYGKLIPAHNVAGRYVDGLNIACLKPDTDLSQDPGLNATIPDVQTFATTATAPSQPNSTPHKRQASNNQSPWCMIQSQNWVGSDIIRPDCTSAKTSPGGTDQCSDPTNVPPENERIANLYPDSMLCSDCFIKMFYLRLASPYLPDTDYSDYLVNQYADILNVCKRTNMPELIVREAPYYAEAPSNSTSSPPNVTTINAATGPCSGQTIKLSDIAGSLTVSKDGTMCDALSSKLNVATGDLWNAFGNPSCEGSSSSDSICVPATCTLAKVPQGATCDSMAAAAKVPGVNVTSVQFQLWNQNLLGLCDSLVQGQMACVSPPGGAYVQPPVNLSAASGPVVRGGGDGSSASAHAPHNTTNTAPPGTSVQSGIPSSCKTWAQAAANDNCPDFARANSISAATLYSLNPVLGADGKDCPTKFWVNYWYCIAGASSASEPSSSPTPTTSNQPAKPTQTQAGLASNCNKFQQAKAGDGCQTFSKANGISEDDLFKWNPVLGAGGKDCNTQFWTNYFYCTGVSS